MTKQDNTAVELYSFMDSLGWVYGKYDDQMWHKFRVDKENTMSQESALEIMQLIQQHTEAACRKAILGELEHIVADNYYDHDGIKTDVVDRVAELKKETK